MRLARPFREDWPITQFFGERPHIYGRWGLAGHNGVDWGTPNGTILLAPLSGQIRYFRDLPAGEDAKAGYGYNCEIWGNEWYVILAHGTPKGFLAPDRSHVEVGQEVLVADNTGYSTGPHVHFGLRPVNSALWTGPMMGWVDPLPMIDRTVDKIVAEIEHLHKLKQTMEWAFQTVHDATHNLMNFDALPEPVRKELRRAEIGVAEARGDISTSEALRLRKKEYL